MSCCENILVYLMSKDYSNFRASNSVDNNDRGASLTDTGPKSCVSPRSEFGSRILCFGWRTRTLESPRSHFDTPVCSNRAGIAILGGPCEKSHKHSPSVCHLDSKSDTLSSHIHEKMLVLMKEIPLESHILNRPQLVRCVLTADGIGSKIPQSRFFGDFSI